MKIQPLKAFVMTAELGSISEAARKMGRPRPQVSNWISDLEADWDVELFDRSSHKPELTEAGQQLLDYGRTILRNLDNLDSKVKTLHRQNSQLRMGFERCIAPQQIQRLVEALAVRYPSLTLTVLSDSSCKIQRELQAGRLDIGFCNNYYVTSQDIRMRHAFDSRYIGCCAPDYPLNKIEELTANDVSPYRQIDLFLSEEDLPDTTRFSADVMQVDSFQTMLPLIVNGYGWGICPMSFARPFLNNGELTILNHPAAVGSLPIYVMHMDTLACEPFAEWVIEEAGHYLAAID